LKNSNTRSGHARDPHRTPGQAAPGDRRYGLALRARPPRRPPEPCSTPQRGVTYVPRHEGPITWDICPEPRHPPLRKFRPVPAVSRAFAVGGGGLGELLMVKAGQRRTEIRAPHSLFIPSDDAYRIDRRRARGRSNTRPVRSPKTWVNAGQHRPSPTTRHSPGAFRPWRSRGGSQAPLAGRQAPPCSLRREGRATARRAWLLLPSGPDTRPGADQTPRIVR
jgi:hypothetical protein